MLFSPALSLLLQVTEAPVIRGGDAAPLAATPAQMAAAGGTGLRRGRRRMEPAEP